MGQIAELRARQKETAYAEEKKEADKRRTEKNEFHWEVRSDSRGSLIGRIRRFTRKQSDNFAAMASFLTVVQLVLNDSEQRNKGIGIFAAIGTLLRTYKETRPSTYGLTKDFIVEAQYIADDIADEISVEARKLMDDFNDPNCCTKELRQQALERNGIVFSQDFRTYAVCAHKLNKLRDSFDGSHGSHRVIVFREVAQTHRYVNEPVVTGDPAPVRVYH